jgi:hypothetical protein
LYPIFASPRDVTLNLWLAEREIVNAYIAMKSPWRPCSSTAELNISPESGGPWPGSMPDLFYDERALY